MVMATENTTTNKRTVAGVFSDAAHAERALNGLRDDGFVPDQVSVVANESDDTRRVVENTETGTAEAAGGGAVAGTVIGGTMLSSWP